MDLKSALTILARVHTRDHDQTGFAVVMGAQPSSAGVSDGDYVAALCRVREALGMPTHPDVKEGLSELTEIAQETDTLK